MGSLLLFVSVLVCYCLAGLIVGVHGNRFKRIEDRITRIEIEQARASVSRGEAFLDIFQKLDDIQNLVNESSARQESVSPGVRSVSGATSNDDSLESLTTDVMTMKKAFSEEKARWRREASQIENAIQGLESSLAETITNVIKTVVQEVTHDVNVVKNVVGEVNTTMVSYIKEIQEQMLSLKDSLKDVVANCSQSTENTQPITTQPPTTLPPTTQQPTTQQPTTQQPTTKQPTTQQPTTQPPTTQPTTTQPPTTQPTTTQPPTTQPPTTQPPRPSHCLELYQEGTRLSGAYTIYPEPDKQPLLVYCDMDTDGGGWTVFQRREDGSENFNRNWDDYASGFGDVEHEFWLGNDQISKMTGPEQNELRVDLVDVYGKRSFAKYSSFRVQSSVTNYRLEVGGYSGDAGDRLSYNNGMEFTTKDRDNDKHWQVNCARLTTSRTGAWWYKHCSVSRLNAWYKPLNMRWNHVYKLKWTEMKFRLSG